MNKTAIIVIPRPQTRCSCDNVCKTLWLLGFRETSNGHWIYWIKDSVEFACSVVLDSLTRFDVSFKAVGISSWKGTNEHPWSASYHGLAVWIQRWFSIQAFNHMVYSLQSKASGMDVVCILGLGSKFEGKWRWNEVCCKPIFTSWFVTPCTSLCMCMCI